VEVCLVGQPGREYRKLVSVIQAGFEVRRHWEDDERPPGRGVREGKGEDRCLSRGAYDYSAGTHLVHGGLPCRRREAAGGRSGGGVPRGDFPAGVAVCGWVGRRDDVLS